MTVSTDTHSGRDRRNALKQTLRELYEGDTPRGHRFRYGLLIFDLVTVLFIVASSFLPRNLLVEGVDVLFGLAILADFASRFFISRTRLRDLLHFSTWTDAIAIISFLLPLTGEAAAFARVLRTVRLLRTYQLLARLRADFPWFRRYEEVVITTAHLAIFLFVMSAVVYETQHWTNKEIKNYVDALYFTVTALTTTGFGDITLAGTSGRLISVVIMIFGVTLFLRLIRALLNPDKVRFRCPTCSLMRHDRDAVHCKACGEPLNIPDDEADW